MRQFIFRNCNKKIARRRIDGRPIQQESIVAKATQWELANAVLSHYGQTDAEELGIPLRNTPAPLFQLLCGSLLLNANRRRERRGTSVNVKECKADYPAKNGRGDVARAGQRSHQPWLQTLRRKHLVNAW